MERQTDTHEQKYLTDLVKLARAVFESIKHTPIGDKKAIELVWGVAACLKPVLDEHEHELHPDLGQDMLEYALLKDDGAEYADWIHQYETNTEAMLAAIELRYGIDKDDDAERIEDNDTSNS